MSVNMKCCKCGMSPYLPSWYPGERACPVCGHYPERGRPLPESILDGHDDRKLSSIALNEGPGFKYYEGNAKEILNRGCKWWQGELADGSKKMCFNCGWSECVKNDQDGEGESKNYRYKSRESRGATIIYPEGAPIEDRYVPE